MYSSILLFPLSIFIFLVISHEKRPKNLLISCVVGYMVTISLVFFLFLQNFNFGYSGKYVYVYQFFNWVTLDNVDLGLYIWLDYVSVIMSLTVLFIAFMVNVFSIYYMANDPFIIRFFSYLSLFTFCMLLLVTAIDLLQFFIGWELVGMCSYLLINFWYTRKQANLASLKAVLVNRVGDFFFIWGMSIMFSKFKTLNLYDLSWIFITNTYNCWEFNKLCLIMFFAVMSKSAQIGLHTWLPDAMEGPTPVSALIHAATMVTAGIYLLLRLSLLFMVSENTLKFVTIIGSITALFGSTTGAAQTDIKKIIAFSTCSQLGYMVTACGLAQFNLAFFHLITHAFFKSLLFLSAGIIIHTLGGEQDIRKMGGLINILPTTFAAITTASLALSGIPYLAGYYSKELIISSALLENTWVGFLAFLLLVLSAVFTSFYSAKLIYYVFFSKAREEILNINYIHCENSEYLKIFQILPLVLLSILSIFSGYLFKDIIAGIGSNSTLSLFNEYSLKNSKNLWLEYIPITIKILLNFCSFSGYFFYFLVYKKYTWLEVLLNKNTFSSIIYDFFYNRWNIDIIFSYFLNYIFTFLWEDTNIDIVQKKIVDACFVTITIEITDSIIEIHIDSGINTPQKYVSIVFLVVLLFSFFTDLSWDIFTYYY